MAGQPIDSQEFNRVVQRAVESSYTRTFSHISEIYKRLGSLERTERANLVSIDDLAQLPPAHSGGLAFVKGTATWYYCDGVNWLPVAGGSGGEGMEVHVLANNLALGPYHSMSGATDGDVLRATGGASARFMRLSHDDLDGITADQHHVKLHNITDANHHQISAPDWGVVGAVGANTLGIHTPSADVTGVTKEALLKSNSSGHLTLVRAIASDRVQTPQVENAAGDLVVTASNDVVVAPPHWTMFADNKDMRSQSHLPGFLGQGWRISWPEVDRPHLDIRSIYAEELEVTAFQADIMRVRIAEDFLTQGMAFTAEVFVTPHAVGGEVRVLFEGNPVLGAAQLFLPNEWVMFNIIQRGAGLVVAQIWGQVSDYLAELPDANGVARQSWKFTLRNGATDFVVPKSNICLAWGISGAKNGYIHHNVLSTAYGPWTRYATWTGDNPYTVANRRYHVQTGNLHGLVDIATDRYGIAAGDNLAKTPNDPTNPFKGFTADNVGGMRLFNTDISAYVGAVQKMYIAASGQEMWLGTSASDKRFSYLDGDLTVIGTLEAAGHQFRADEDGVKIKVSPGAAYEGLDESVQWLYNSLDTGLRTWIGTRVYGSGDADSQLAQAAIGAAPGAWGTIALRAREYGQNPLLDTEGATFIVTPRNIWVGPQAGLRISTVPSDIMTPVPGGQLYAETIYAGNITVTGTISGTSMSGGSWEYPGSVLINAHADTDTDVTITNLSAGRADLVVDRDIILGGNVDGVDVSAFKAGYDTHIGNANAHHAQAHSYDSSDHTGTLSWTKLNKTGASLADLPTRLYADLQSRAHVLATNTALGGDHTISGATAGHVLRASAATAAAFAQLQHADLGGVTANQHHNQVHAITGSDHTVAGVRYQIVGIPTSDNVLGLITPAATGNNVILKTDVTGGISLTNLTVANAIVANGGVDYGGDTLIEDINYLVLSGTKPLNTTVTLRALDWSLTPGGLLTVPYISAAGQLVVGPAEDLILTAGSNYVYLAEGTWLASDTYASETTGWGISPLGAGDFRSIYANEIIAKSFIVDLEQALAGGEIVTKSVTKLAVNFAVPHDTTTAITFRALASATITAANTLTIAKPLGVVQYDYLLARILVPSTNSVLTPPAGWSLLTSVTSGTTKLYIYTLPAGAAEGASYAWVLSAIGEASGTIHAYYGIDIANPVVAYTTAFGSGTTITVPGITTTINGVAMVFLAGMYDTTNVGTISTPPAEYVEREDALATTHMWGTAADIIQGPLGLAGNPFATLAVTHPWAAVLVALKPATWNTARFIVEDLPSAAGMAVFEAGDIVRLRQFSRAGGGLNVTDCWGMVGNYIGNGDGTQSWTFARSAPPNAGAITVGTTIVAGSLVLDYGKDGDGFYEINAYSGTYAATAPYSQVVKWTGHPATGQVVRVREGNLEGITAQADEYGLWAGSKTGVTLADTDSYLRVSNQGVLLNNVPLKIFNNLGVQTVNIDTNGQDVWIGVGKLLHWNGSTLAITGAITALSGTISGILTIGSSGQIVAGTTRLNNTGVITYAGTPGLEALSAYRFFNSSDQQVGSVSCITPFSGLTGTIMTLESYSITASDAVMALQIRTSAVTNGIFINSEEIRLFAPTLNAYVGGNSYTIWHRGNDGAGSGLDAGLLCGMGLRGTSNNWGNIAYIDASGVLDAGRYIDFHNTDAGSEDYSVRLDTGGGTTNLSINGSAIWHAGNFTPGSYAPLASPVFTGTPKVGSSTIWHSGNFNATDIVSTSLRTTGGGNAIWLDSRDGNAQFGIYNTTNLLRFWTTAGDRAWIDTGGTVYAAGSFSTGSGYHYSGSGSHAFYNSSGSAYGHVSLLNVSIVGGNIYSDNAYQFLTLASAAQGIRAASILASNDYSHTTRVPSNGIYSLGAVLIGGTTAITAGYAFEVNGGGRITGAWRTDLCFSLKVQSSMPTPSASYGILYVGADGSLYYLRPNGSSGQKISA